MKAIILSGIKCKDHNYDAVMKIIESLKKKVILYSDHIMEMTQDKRNLFSEDENYNFHKDILNKINQSDIIVAECTNQSLSLGYLLSYAVEQAKPVIIFFNATSSKSNLFPTLANKVGIYFVE